MINPPDDIFRGALKLLSVSIYCCARERTGAGKHRRAPGCTGPGWLHHPGRPAGKSALPPAAVNTPSILPGAASCSLKNRRSRDRTAAHRISLAAAPHPGSRCGCLGDRLVNPAAKIQEVRNKTGRGAGQAAVTGDRKTPPNSGGARGCIITAYVKRRMKGKSVGYKFSVNNNY